MEKEEIMKKQEKLKEKVDTHRPSHGRSYRGGWCRRLPFNEAG
jgi:hypothetical protein